ncbi:MAG: HAMP domain-containing sensor histidine kinase [Candidatus Eisenbacteria bacterium]
MPDATPEILGRPPTAPASRATRPRPAALDRIGVRIFASLVLLTALLLVGLSLLIEREARRALETELDLRLRAVGASAVSLVGPALVPGLLSLTPAQENFRLYQERRQILTQLRDRTGVRRIFLADPGGRSYVDTDTRITIGVPLPQLRTDRTEVARVLGGDAASGALFTDDAGQYRKTGYVPVEVGGKVVALVGVEADARFLDAVRALRRRILLAGAGAIGVAFLLAAAVARGLTRPLDRLMVWAASLGSGDLASPAPHAGRGEIGVLARTLDQMRVEIEARDREQRAMVAGVAHEIRNPLSGIRLYTELLQNDRSLGEDQRRRLDKILKELDHLGAVVEQFLLYARPAEPMRQAIDLRAFAAEMAEWLRPQAALREVRLSLHCAEAPVALADPTHLRQVGHNLLRNAIEASPTGGEVRLECRAEGADSTFVVEDDGPGLAPEAAARLFEPFFTTKTAGAGLGLAIVQRLVLLNHGRVTVSTGTRGGARFEVALPSK